MLKAPMLPRVNREQSDVYRHRQASSQSIATGDRRTGRHQMILNQHRVTVVALVLVIAALFAAPASAEPVDKVGPVAQPASSASPTPTPFGTEQAATAPTTPTEVRIVRVSSESGTGFDWGDAGIGAGAGLALTMIGVGGALAMSTRRHRARTEKALA